MFSIIPFNTYLKVLFRVSPQRRFLLFILSLLLLGNAHVIAVTAQSESYEVQLSTDPGVIEIGKAQLIIELRSQGEPVTDAKITTLTFMPGMPMGEREARAQPRSGAQGVYEAPASFPMEGAYEVALEIDGRHGKASLKIPLKTGQNTAEASAFPWKSIVVFLLLLAILSYTLYRMKVTGQRLEARKVFQPAALLGLGLLAALLFGTVYAVQHWRRPGAMTPIETLGMTMEMPAPAGVLPVRLATVNRGNVNDEVVYSGQAAGLVEQDVYPRVTGIIEWMPFYAGDAIKKGQVLARLDTRQYDAEVAVQRAAAAAARQQIGVAQAENRAARSQAGEAEAQVGAQSNLVIGAERQTEEAGAVVAQKREVFNAAGKQVEEARRSLEEAQETHRAQLAAQRQAQNEIAVTKRTQAALQTKITSAETTIEAANADVASAQADVDYWKTELARLKVLLQENVVSQRAYDEAVAQSTRATAQLSHARAQVKQAQATLGTAQAEFRAAQARTKSSQSAAAAAAAQTAASKTRVEQARANVGQMEALRGAAKAEVDRAQKAADAARAGADAERSGLQAQRRSADAAHSGAAAASGRVGVAQSAAQQAAAQLTSAEINRGYTLIRAQVDGVVTKRLISPGVLVTPGQAILQIAQIDRIRLQVNVPEEDLRKIGPGTPVRVSPDDAEASISARVTSVAPHVDAASRTGIVETIIDNPAQQFLPGQSVKMAITLGQAADVLRVPSNAIQWKTDSGTAIEATATTPFVWIAKADHGAHGTFTAQQVAVQLGMSDGRMTAIRSGLQPGMQVVLGSSLNLVDGMPLVDASRPNEKTTEHQNHDAHTGHSAESH